MQRVIVAITGATGVVLGVRLLQALQGKAETHLVITKWGLQTLLHETSLTREQVQAMATVTYSQDDLGAAIASGSFLTAGMAIVPCSMRTLAAIATGAGFHLVHRAADVVLKEKRRLVVVAREMPLSDLHLENMLKLARAGATIMPPMPAFYNHAETIDDMVDHIVSRIADQLGFHLDIAPRWDGVMKGSR